MMEATGRKTDPSAERADAVVGEQPDETAAKHVGGALRVVPIGKAQKDDGS